MLNARHQLLPSRALGRNVHLWTYGWWGEPVLVFPSASGMAHEWQAGGAIDALRPLIEGGRIKLYCPESNVSEAWTEGEGAVAWRLGRHQAYEHFITEELVPFIREDCRSPEHRLAAVGVSFGAFYAVNTTLKHPETFHWALGLSGRYHTRPFVEGHEGLDAYYNQPLAYVPNLSGAALERVRQNTRVTLVVGLGPWEGRCVDETLSMARALADRGIPLERDVWGHDAAHHWDWWRRQLVHHLGRRFA